jgi:glycosyltransferase involved in cell wall biosynthesis
LRQARPDLVLTYNWGAIEALLTVQLSRLCPAIHHECGFGHDEAVSRKPRRNLARRLLLPAAAATVVVSKTLAGIARQEFHIPEAKLRWIRTGVDTERFQPGTGDDWRRHHGVARQEFLIGFAGRLSPEKNLPLLLTAFAESRLQHSRLALLGEGPERTNLELLANRLGLGGRVLFLGESDDVPAFLQALDLFALSSSTEQTPNSLLEAMSCGLAAISTDVGDCADILAATGPPSVVPPGDVHGYAESMRQWESGVELRRRLGEQNRNRCLELYSFPRMVNDYADVYRAALLLRKRVAS